MDEALGTTGSARAGDAALFRLTALGDGGDLPALTEEILKVTLESLSCERAVLALYDEAADRFEMHISGRAEPWSLPLNEPSISRRIFHRGSGEVVNDVMTDIDANQELVEELNTHQLVGAPLTVGGRRLGVLSALNARDGAFTEQDLRTVGEIADRAALLIDNARLKAELERARREVAGLHRLSRLVTAAEASPVVERESLRVACDLLGCSKAALLMHDDAAGKLVATSAVGMSPAEVAALKVPLARPSLVATVFRTDTPLLSNDAPGDAWVGPELGALDEVASVLAAPLGSGQPVGVLLAARPEPGAFGDADLRFASLLGGRIGAVLEASAARARERLLVQKLREADRTKTEFVSILAHELKGPMTSVLGFSEVLRDRWDSLDDAKRTQALDLIAKEVDRLSRLVNDLLDVSRMEAGTLRYEMAPLDLTELIDNVLTVHPSLGATHAIDTRVPRDLPKVLGDRDRVRQVLLNLLTNAVRYSPEGTAVVIGAKAGVVDERRMVEVWVADQGIGIPPEHADTVFSKFVMLPKPGWVRKGTGLGLFITKGIVEAHGGRIWVESEPGAGAIFRFTLPAA
jgi:signal transduction histidine kinase